MKVAILILALLSTLTYGQSIFGSIPASCSTQSGCNLGDILLSSTITALTGGTVNLDFSAAGSGLNININAGLLSTGTISLASLAVAGRNTVTVVAGVTVQTANFTVASASTAVVNGIVNIQAAANAATTFTIDSSSAVYVSASGKINAGATNIVAQGQANVAGGIQTTGSYAQNAGNLVLNSTGTTAATATAYVYASNVNIGSSATLSGNGIVGGSSASATATVQIDGTMNIGNSPGVVTVNGDWRPSGTSTFNLEIQSSTSYDQLIVTGKAYVAGSLRVTLLNSYSPSTNQHFPFITANGGTDGNFHPVTGTSTNTLFAWTSSVTSSQVIANFNGAAQVAISGLVLIACVLASMM